MKIINYFAVLSLFLIQNVYAGPRWYAAKDGTRFLIEKAYEYNWFQASHECARRDAQLVAIDSEKKNNQIKQVLEDALISNHNLWIGGNDAYGERQDNLRPFFWSATGQEFSFTYWAESQPDNSLYKEHCVHIIRYSYPPYAWNDNSCHNTEMGYICEERVRRAFQKKTSDTTDEEIYSEDSEQISQDFKISKLGPIHEHKLQMEDEISGEVDVKELKIASENIRKWKDIVKNSIRKTELDIIGSLFKFNRAVFKEPQDLEK